MATGFHKVGALAPKRLRQAVEGNGPYPLLLRRLLAMTVYFSALCPLTSVL